MPKATAIRFPTTRWWLLDQVAQGGAERHRALAELLGLYYEPVRAFVAAHAGVRADQTDDVVQEFLTAKWLEQDLVARVKAERGRFRSYLLAALNNFISNYLRAGNGAAGACSLTTDPVDGSADPADVFDLAWARQVVRAAVDRMRDGCAAAGRADVWAVFEGRVLGPVLHGAAPAGYGELVARLGFESPARASNVLMTAKRSFARALRDVIRDHEGEGCDVEAELADLRRALTRPRPAVGPAPPA